MIRYRSFVYVYVICALLGCKDILETDRLGSGLTDITTLKSREGAVRLYRGAICSISGCGTTLVDKGAFENFLTATGMFSDELLSSEAPPVYDHTVSSLWIRRSIDIRKINDQSADVLSLFEIYRDLHIVRARSTLAVETIKTLSDSTFNWMQAHLYGVWAFAEILLADSYCNGVPLSQIDLNFSYKEGRPARDVYQHAITLLDSAISLEHDSTRILNLNRVLKGRAHIARGEYQQAEEAVKDIPVGFVYTLKVRRPAVDAPDDIHSLNTANIGDRKGMVGIDYVSSKDPRLMVKLNRRSPHNRTTGINAVGVFQYYPAKYADGTTNALTTNPPTTFDVVVASGVEGKLILAEAALNSGRIMEWLRILNDLRASCANEKCVSMPVPGRELAPLVDPPGTGTEQSVERIKLLFRERAIWTYLTGRRLGDMRRLVREYGLSPDDVYPNGPYHMGAPDTYGNQLALPIPRNEELNPKFVGCLDNEA